MVCAGAYAALLPSLPPSLPPVVNDWMTGRKWSGREGRRDGKGEEAGSRVLLATIYLLEFIPIKAGEIKSSQQNKQQTLRNDKEESEPMDENVEEEEKEGGEEEEVKRDKMDENKKKKKKKEAENGFMFTA